MTTNDPSNPAGQCPLELVEILKRLGAHRRAVYEQIYGNPPWTRGQSDTYWYHPLVRACEWLEQRMGISRHELEDAAFRLTTPQGLRGMDPLMGPGGRTMNVGQPDLLWMIPKFRELDRDGTTARLWDLLVEKYPAILADAGMLVPLGNGGGDGQRGPDDAERSADESILETGFLGGAALADALGVHLSQRGAFFKQLERERTKLADGVWIESANRRPNAPLYLYLARDSAIRAIAAQYREPKPA